MNAMKAFHLPAARWLTVSSLLVSSSTLVAADGNVRVVSDHNGSILVIGDESDNEVRVGRTGQLNQFEVFGEGTTRVNGESSVVIAADGVMIFLRSGDDRVQVDGNIHGNVVIDGGAGNDQLALGDPSIEGWAFLSGGDGDDRLSVDDTLVENGLKLSGGAGDDTITLGFASVFGDLRIEGGIGDDEIGAFHVRISGRLRLDAGRGADELQLQSCTVSADALLALAEGGDRAELRQNTLGGRLRLALGSGNDTALLGGNEVQKAAMLFGGPGQDAYSDDDSDDFAAGPPQIGGFEGRGSGAIP